MRRLFEEKSIDQGYNGFKYILIVVAVCLGMAYEVDVEKDRQVIWRLLGGITSAMAVVFCTYWDLVYDWGLLNRTSKNPWLRDNLLVPYKEVYFIAMVSFRTLLVGFCDGPPGLVCMVRIESSPDIS